MPNQKTDAPRATRTHPLADTSVLVTGATGFIGARLAARLADEGATVTGAGRKLPHVAHLWEQGIRLERLDLRHSDEVETVVQGQEIVFHTAAVLQSNADTAQAVNVEATDALVRCAADAGVRRIVHVSTVGVYDMSDQTVVREATPLAVHHSSVYPRTKAQAEVRAVDRAAEAGIELAIVRPTMVYGPGPSVWTGMIEKIRAGQPVYLGDGSAHFHPVYVDDIVEALLRCATTPDAGGEAFNISAETTTWRAFMSHYGRLCGVEPKGLPLWMAKGLAAANWIPWLETSIDHGFIEMATSRKEFPTDKARRVLGWEPQVSLTEGMHHTERWLRKKGLVR